MLEQYTDFVLAAWYSVCCLIFFPCQQKYNGYKAATAFVMIMTL